MPKEISRSLILDPTAQNIFFAVYNIHGLDPLLIIVLTLKTTSTDLASINLQDIPGNAESVTTSLYTMHRRVK
jgi:hypothetical protein